MLKIIAAMDDQGLIGANGGLPWNNAEDLKHFKSLTMGCNILCGRVTAQTLPELAGRNKFVLTRSPTCPAELAGKSFVPYPVEALRDFNGWVIGGAQVYDLALPFADELYLTHIPGEHEGDTYFPEVSDEWQLVERKPAATCTFEKYHRK